MMYGISWDTLRFHGHWSADIEYVMTKKSGHIRDDNTKQTLSSQAATSPHLNEMGESVASLNGFS